MFASDWAEEIAEEGITEYFPALVVYIRELGGLKDYKFLVDSGAAISVAPRELADRIGIRWEYGIKTTLKGIARKKTCEIEGMIHEVEVFIREANLTIKVPICFAIGEVPLILGRFGLFDYFLVIFDKEAKKTYFELQESVKKLLFPDYMTEEPRIISAKYVLIDYDEYQKLISEQ